ncbi:putative exopolyphosphatase [Mycena sanguinolenta]|uniref:Putative exopolyphosphatase n=1 Tax=Mycena sanguinolenta TaxID=230812 RepID=A0A8H6YYD3_9AGAR|nr:putative exopolyphosphatase [Mycena sanguinolenta]
MSVKPSALRRLSTLLAGKPPGPPVLESSSLANFLSTSKEKYLADIRATPSKGAEWTVVMGNEAGDLDSVASSIAYAWVQSEIQKKPCVPLIQIGQDDLNLRAENLYALKLAGISDPQKQLLSITDLDGVKPFPSTTFALVDHNRLGNTFSKDNPNTSIVAVIDHHADEQLYADCDPRKVAPAGSCASHVATLYPKEAEMPRELATLLLSAILIDTGGLVPGGKALQVDHEAASYLIPRSTLFSSSTLTSISPTNPEMLSSIAEVKRLSDALAEQKFNVSHLGAWDLLRRDYKEYTHTLNWHPGAPTIKAGLATVPVKLRSWGSDGKLERESQRWMEQRGLSVFGVLTSFRDTKKFGESGKGKHRREQAWFIRDGSDSTLQLDDIASRLWKGLEADEEIKVTKHEKMNLAKSKDIPPSVRAKTYKQGNANATRKATAPLLKNILESSE